MKKIIIAILTLCNFSIVGFAQECDIALQTIITPPANGINLPQANSYLTNKLRGLTSQSSTLSALDNEQFAIAASYDVLDKQIIAGSPTKIAYNLSLSLFIVDIINQKIFNSFNTELKGIGDNETKAMVNCFKVLNVNNNNIKSFVQEGKTKIIDYYNSNYQNIIKNAQTLASMKNYDEAIYKLSMIPECCNGYEVVMSELKQIYQQFVNQHCAENLAQARSAWYSSPNSDGASVASVYLSEIYPDASCYSDALALYSEIKKKLGEDWKFVMQQYKDSIELERLQINAMRDIEIAYANSRPKETVNIFWK